MFSRDEGMLILSKMGQSSKAFWLIVVNVLGNMTSLRFSHREKQPDGIAVTFSGMVMVSNLVLLKAEASMVVRFSGSVI